MADNQTKVSNSYLSSNPDFEVADDLVGTKRYQQVKLIDPTSGSTTPIGTAANPLHVQGSAVGGDVNIAEYGGVATSLGQKAMSASMPVTIASDQTAPPDGLVISTTTGSFTGAGQSVTIADPRFIVIEVWGTANLLLNTAADVGGTNVTISGSLSPTAADSGVTAIIQFTGSAARFRWKGSVVDAETFKFLVTSYTSGSVNYKITNLNWPDDGTSEAQQRAIANYLAQLYAATSTDAYTFTTAMKTIGWNTSITDYQIPLFAEAAPASGDAGLITRSINYGSNSGTPTAEATNSLGEQRVVSGYATTTTDTITSLGDSVVADVTGYQSALIEISGTYTSVNLTFEISVDGTNFTAASARNLTTNVIQSSTGILTNTRTMYRLTVAGATHVRARCTNFVSGTQTVKIAPSAFPAESVQTSTVYQGAGWTSYLLDQNGSFLDKQDNNWTSEHGIVNLYYDSANSWWSAMYGDVNGPYVQINGQVSTLELFRHGTATLSNVSASASSVTLLASNTNRRKAHFYNDSAYLCYLKFGSSASSTSFTTIVQPGGYFAIDVAPPYYGIITGIWPTASGTMRVTEETF